MKYIKEFSAHSNYAAFLQTADYITPNVSLCVSENEVHYNPYNDPYNGHAYVEIGGIKWATMNIGANSVTDTGLYFQWGDTQGYTAAQVGEGEGKKYFAQNDDCIHYNDGDFTKYNYTDSKITLELTDDAVNAAWGGNWRMPTISEFIVLSEAVTTTWTNDYQGSGIAGLVCTDKTDSSKTLFFPACGYATSDSINDVGSFGVYWSSSLSTMSGTVSAQCAGFSLDHNFDENTTKYRCEGVPVRGIWSEN